MVLHAGAASRSPHIVARSHPWMIGLLATFITYQAYQLTQHSTAGLVALTVFDVIVVLLTVREYRHKRSRTH